MELCDQKAEVASLSRKVARLVQTSGHKVLPFLLATACQALALLGAFPAFSLSLAPAEVGILALLCTSSTVSAAVVDSGVGSLVSRDLLQPVTAAGVWGLMSTGLLLQLVFSLLTLVVSAFTFVLFDSRSMWIVVAFGAMTLASAQVLQWQGVFRSERREWNFLVSSIISFLLPFAAAAMVALTSHRFLPTLLALAGGLLIGSSVSLTWAVGPRLQCPDRQSWGRVRSLGLPLVPHSLAAQLLSNIPRWVLASIAGLGAVASFQVVSLVAAAPIIAMGSINNFWAVRVLEASVQSRERVIRFWNERMLLLGLLMAVMASIVAPYWSRRISSHDVTFRDFMAVGSLIAASVVPMVFYTSASHFLLAEEKVRRIVWCAPVAAAITVGGAWLSVSRRGVLGAGLSVFGGQLVLASFVWFVARRVGYPKRKPTDIAVLILTCFAALGAGITRNPVVSLAGLLAALATALVGRRFGESGVFAHEG